MNRELQKVFDKISGVRLDPELSSAPRKVQVDFMSRLDVYLNRPRNRATNRGLHVIPTKWVGANKGDRCQATRVQIEIVRGRWDRSSA